MTYEIGKRVLARVDYRDEFYPATIVDTKGWYFVGKNQCGVEFDVRPITSAGTLNARRVVVGKHNIKEIEK